ncbi:MAG: response regulator [Treponema sp.]|jgi:two-component system chemotaxis response regulator CheY|nr:response regulator [Treponema sp.]
MTILIVDDSQLIRKTIKRCLENLNIPCLYKEAGNGKDALKQLQEHAINLVFLDWNMPGMSGIEFLKQIRSMDKYKTLPIIMVTSEAARANIIEAVTCGVTDYIVKPIREQYIRDKVLRILSKQG